MQHRRRRLSQLFLQSIRRRQSRVAPSSTNPVEPVSSHVHQERLNKESPTHPQASNLSRSHAQTNPTPASLLSLEEDYGDPLMDTASPVKTHLLGISHHGNNSGSTSSQPTQRRRQRDSVAFHKKSIYLHLSWLGSFLLWLGLAVDYGWMVNHQFPAITQEWLFLLMVCRFILVGGYFILVAFKAGSCGLVLLQFIGFYLCQRSGRCAKCSMGYFGCGYAVCHLRHHLEIMSLLLQFQIWYPLGCGRGSNLRMPITCQSTTHSLDPGTYFLVQIDF